MADLLTVDDVATVMGIEDTSDDWALLKVLIDAAQERIEGILDNSLDVVSSCNEYHDAGKKVVWVRRRPIVAIHTVQDSAWPKGSNAARTISSDDWVADTDDGGKNYKVGKVELCNHESSFGGGRLDAYVQYSGGWTASTLPQDLRLAWIELVAYWYNHPDRVGVLSQGGGGANVLFQKLPIPLELMAVFSKYSLARSY